MKLSTEIRYPKWIGIQLVEKYDLLSEIVESYHEKTNFTFLDYSIIEQVIKDCLPKKPFFELLGDEPFLYPKIENVIRKIKEQGSILDICTKGTVIEENSEMLVEIKPTHLHISLDGPQKIHDENNGRGMFQKVTEGIRKLQEIREIKRSYFPKIGIDHVVTPLNHLNVEELFFDNLVDLKIDQLNIYLQSYITRSDYESYLKLLKTEFDISTAPHAKSLIQELSVFSEINFEAITEQMVRIREYCQKHDIYLVTIPKNMEANNIKNLFMAHWKDISNKRSHCAFPWLYAEISAQGNVTFCHHPFHDLPVGNVYKKSILDIWNGKAFNKVRKYMRRNLLPICPACELYYIEPYINSSY